MKEIIAHRVKDQTPEELECNRAEAMAAGFEPGPIEGAAPETPKEK